MTRKILLSELEKGAAANGLTYRTGAVHEINHRLGSGPELWVEPPEVISHTGRTEGTRVYRVPLRLVRAASAANGEGTDGLEHALSGLALHLARHEDIAGMPGIAYTTERNTLTNRGEVSVKAVLTITTRF
ncbi:MAG: hypothetical protein LIO85_04580 [Rikenellaceae bacterium]|nr:hypothetical protein [Rikenellaceae bacterium]